MSVTDFLDIQQELEELGFTVKNSYVKAGKLDIYKDNVLRWEIRMARLYDGRSVHDFDLVIYETKEVYRLFKNGPYLSGIGSSVSKHPARDFIRCFFAAEKESQ